MTAIIERHHDDHGSGETTGVLDTNADGDELLYTAINIQGRIQIAAHWYDRFDRLIDTVTYGTHGGTDLDRDALTVPNRSDTALRTTWVYSDADGELQSITDPKDLVTRYEHDAAGRQTAVIANYVDGTPSGDSDHFTRFAYTDGLLTKIVGRP